MSKKKKLSRLDREYLTFCLWSRVMTTWSMKTCKINTAFALHIEVLEPLIFTSL